MQATMKNTKISTSEGGNLEMHGRKILQRINDIGHQTYKLKKDVNDFYSVVLKKNRIVFLSESDRTAVWKGAFDNFSERWKEIDVGKYEVACMVRDLYSSVEQEDEKHKGKIVLNIE